VDLGQRQRGLEPELRLGMDRTAQGNDAARMAARIRKQGFG
jgi:hypothetical protein